MFWGVTLESGKRYTQVVDSSFHVSMATLEPLQKEPSEKYVKLMIEHRNADFLLCVLKYNDVLQVALDLNFVEGEEICFYLNGAEGTIHLSGYLSEFDNLQGLDEEDEADEENASDEEGSEDDEVPTCNKAFQLVELEAEESNDSDFDPDKEVKKKVKAKQKPEKKPSVFDYAADEESSDEDVMADEWEDQSDEEGESEEEDSEGDEEESEEEAVPKLVGEKRKRGKISSKIGSAHKEKQEQKQQQKKESLSSVTTQEMSPEKKAEAPSKRKQKKKRKIEENNVEEKSSPAAASKVQGGTTHAGGVRSQDLLVGSGPVAKRGKRVHVYYTGRLPNNNNRQFDACQSGKPFSFILGRGTVIKGWETGIEGMKVGGKRRLVIPPSQGYANNRVGSIPPNSTLTFDVELKAVS